MRDRHHVFPPCLIPGERRARRPSPWSAMDRLGICWVTCTFPPGAIPSQGGWLLVEAVSRGAALLPLSRAGVHSLSWPAGNPCCRGLRRGRARGALLLTLSLHLPGGAEDGLAVRGRGFRSCLPCRQRHPNDGAPQKSVVARAPSACSQCGPAPGRDPLTGPQSKRSTSASTPAEELLDPGGTSPGSGAARQGMLATLARPVSRRGPGQAGSGIENVVAKLLGPANLAEDGNVIEAGNGRRWPLTITVSWTASLWELVPGVRSFSGQTMERAAERGEPPRLDRRPARLPARGPPTLGPASRPKHPAISGVAGGDARPDHRGRRPRLYHMANPTPVEAMRLGLLSGRIPVAYHRLGLSGAGLLC